MYFYCKSLCILIAVYVFLLFVHVFLLFVHVFLLFVHVFLLLSMYSYCCLYILIVRPSYRCLCILILVYVFLDAATLIEVFPCFFLGCKANARV